MADEVIDCTLRSRMEIVDEDRLLVRAALHDSDTAARLYDKYYSTIFGYIYRCTFDQTLAEDLTSNVFLAVFQHLGRFQWRQVPFGAWLYRVAVNEVRMHYRRTRRVAGVAVEAAQRTASEATSAGDNLTTTEEHRLLREALLEVKLKYRTVIILRYFQDKAIAEISEITGRRPGTIKSQLHRGLAQLQDILLRYGVLPPWQESGP